MPEFFSKMDLNERRLEQVGHKYDEQLGVHNQNTRHPVIRARITASGEIRKRNLAHRTRDSPLSTFDGFPDNSH